ncbi:hypothetical protein NG895_25300 [Aeoliella sp. ICT_H6.2]|uniref:Uncharacterized protein n=1 Tax=Aeoliella straminimaris TaxID=2954799 RepID=A0A9X2JIM1_9BACT|nr:hypothetical protein [Aeoliella straminimaris]MCO6047230.1 hypothetical protein [Aeoliella straminimaris]
MSAPHWLPHWLDEEEWAILKSKGWTEEMLERLKPTPEKEAIEHKFTSTALRALSVSGYSALEFLASNPDLSPVRLAERLNHGANARGLVAAMYREAIQCDSVRKTAKELLVRALQEKFCNGWTSRSKIRPSVKLGSWESDFCRNVNNKVCIRRVRNIFRHLTVDDPPVDGWKPHDDDLLDELFDMYWPIP